MSKKFYDVEFKRHPAKNSNYINSLSSQDSTNNVRSAYNIQTKENKKRVKLDMKYIKNMGFFFDLRIILKTIFIFLTLDTEGAY